MSTLAYFCLLFPEECTRKKPQPNPVYIQYVVPSFGNTSFVVLSLPPHISRVLHLYKYGCCHAEEYCAGEVIVYEASIDHILLPKTILLHHVFCLTEHGTGPSQNLDTFKQNECWVNFTPVGISKDLKYSIRFLGLGLCFVSKGVSACSLCETGAMDILFSGVETEIINLVGHCQPDEMLRYLHIELKPVVVFAIFRVKHDVYRLPPNHEVTNLAMC